MATSPVPSRSWRFLRLLCLLFSTAIPIEVAAADDRLDLVPKRAVWRHLDDGSDQLKAWREPMFDDSNWPEGRAELGFGDGGEATRLKPGPTNNRTITFYFRHRFQVSSETLQDYHFLMLELLADDGAVVHVNGRPALTVNLPEEPFYDELAKEIIWDTIEGRPTPHRLDLGLLHPGENVIAVELHQAEIEGVDASFDLRLSAGRHHYGLRVPVPPFQEGAFVGGVFLTDRRRSLVLSHNSTFHEPVTRFDPNEGGEEVPRIGMVPLVSFRSAVGDMNGDGIDEIVSPPWISDPGSAPVALGSVDPVTGIRSEYLLELPLPNGKLACAIGERDGDGRPDLFVMRQTDREAMLFCFRQTRNLEFEPPEQIVAGPVLMKDNAGTGLLAGDFNGDGRADLILFSQAIVYSLRQETDGSYGTAVSIPVNLDAALTEHGAFQPWQGFYPDVGVREIVDLNSDGKDDLVLSHGFHLGNATGRFSTVRSVSGASTLFASDDFDRDGDLDLLGTGTGGTELMWFLNSGKAVFSDPVAVAPVSRVMTAGVAGDMTGDGQPDLLIDDVDLGIFLLPRLTPGVPVIQKFEVIPVGEGQPIDEATVSWKVHGADTVDISPRPGLVGASGSSTVRLEESTSLTLRSANALGESALARRATVPIFRVSSRHDFLPAESDQTPRQTATGLLDGDSVTDIVWNEQHALFVGLRGSDSTSISIEQIASLPPLLPFSNVGTLLTTDFDADGRGDVLSSIDGSWFLVRQSADGQFEAPAKLIESAVGSDYRYTGFADIDGDGDVDFHGTTAFTGGMVFRTNDGGTLGAARRIGSRLDGGSGIEFALSDGQPAVWIDADGDGDKDIVGANGGGLILVRLANHQPEGEPVCLLPGHLRHLRFAGIDLDQDADEDLIYSMAPVTNSGPLTFAFMNGETGLASTPVFLCHGGTVSASYDLNGDGQTDLLNPVTGSWLRGLGNGRFAPESGFPWNVSAGFGVPASFLDWDGDGDLDAFKFGRRNPDIFDPEQVGFWVENLSPQHTEKTTRLEISDIVIESNEMVVRWSDPDAAADAVYQVELSTNLSEWSPLASDRVAFLREGDTFVAKVPLSATAERDRVFYARIRTTRPEN